MTELSELEQLKLARHEVDLQRKKIEEEMVQKSAKGVLWTNGQCKAWPDYQKAYNKLEDLREKFGT